MQNDGKRSEGRPDLPPKFHNWPLEQRGDFLAFNHGREGVLRKLRIAVGTNPDERSEWVQADTLGMALALIYQETDPYPYIRETERKKPE